MRAILTGVGLRPMRIAMHRTALMSGSRWSLAAAFATLAMLTAPALAAGEATPAASTPVNTSAPTLSGTPAPGQTLTCSQGGWSGNPNGFSYAWLRDGVPIPGQSASTYAVQSADQGHSISCQVTASNGGGEFTIVGLTSGSYKVGFFPFEGNYLFQYFNGQPTESTATPVGVTAPNVTSSGVNAELHSGGVITGKATAAAGGAALAEVFVCASDEGVGGGCEVTNAGGEYTIVGLPTGSYTVSFFPFAGNYLSQSYASNPVSVTAGSTTSNVNAALEAGGQISGRLTAESGGSAIASGQACAYEPISKSFGGCATTNGNGEYTIQGLPSGGYEVSFDAFGCNESGCKQQNYLEKTVTSVTVTAGATTSGVNAQLATGGQVSGTVSGLEGGGGVEVCAFESTEGYVQCESINGSGEYTIPALITGEYDVQFFPTNVCGPTGCVRSNYLIQEYGKNPVTVTAGLTTPNVNATMSPAGKISGRLTAESGGGAIAGGTACAYESISKSFGGCATTNGNGEYVLQGLSSGTYEVRFSGFGCTETACTQQNYVAKTATSVPVTAGSTTSGVDAALRAGGQITGRVTDAATHAGLANVEVCASMPVAEEFFGSCATTNGAASSSAVAHSAALAVPSPNNGFKLIGKPSFNSKTGNLVFTFQFPNAGHLGWSLFFRNSDVGFADSLNISLGEGTVAEAAKSKGKKSKKCKKGFKKHKGKCVRTLVPFSSGAESVSAGTVQVKVHASNTALKALKSGHTLHVSGTFTFQSSLGGKAAHASVSAVVHPSKKKGKHHRHHG